MVYLDADGNSQDAELLYYKSADAAAVAFSENIYGFSLFAMLEYSTEIYYISVNGSKRYYYTKPAVGSPHKSSGIDPNHVPRYGIQVAYAHTHPHSNTFSKPDYNYANSHSIDAYVIGPNLWVQKYSYYDDEVTKISMATVKECGVIQPERLNFLRSIWESHFVDGVCPNGFNCIIDSWPNQ